MRGTLRLFASVKPVRYLEAGAPTGLAGLRTNSSPRSTLLYLYHRTLDKLADVPETSLYRQSVEAVTKQRMGLVQAVKPAGYDEWAANARAVIQQHPYTFTEAASQAVQDIESLLDPKALEDDADARVVQEKVWSYLEGLSLDGKPYFLRPQFSTPADEREEDAVDIARYDSHDSVEHFTAEEEEAFRKWAADGQPDLGDKKKKPLEFASQADYEQFLKNQKKEAAPASEATPKDAPPDLLFLDQEPRLTADQYGIPPPLQIIKNDTEAHDDYTTGSRNSKTRLVPA